MNNTSQPWEPQDVEEDVNSKLLEKFLGERDGYVTVGPKKYFFPKTFGLEGKKFYDFQPRSNDTWIVTYPRSGTTLTQELTWILGNKFDYKTAAERSLPERYPFLEWGTCVNQKLRSELLQNTKHEYKNIMEDVTSCPIPFLEDEKNPRFIKTHLPFSLLNPNLTTCGAKVIYIARNPKEVIPSYYHLHQLFKTLDFVGTFDEYVDFFIKDQMMWNPYWEHIEEGWQLKDSPNVLFLFYDEILKEMTKTIHRIADFMMVGCTTEQASTLAEHLHISNFRSNASVNMSLFRKIGVLNVEGQAFVRRGGQKENKSDFTEEQEIKINDWVKKNLEKSTIRFPNMKFE